MSPIEMSLAIQKLLHKGQFWLTGCIIIAFGGISLAKFYPMDRAAEKQTSLLVACPTFQETQSLPEAREQLSAASVQVGEQNFIYAVGGQNHSEAVVNTVFYAKVHTQGQIDGWETKKSVFERGFKYPALISIQNRLYVLGGKDSGDHSLDSVYQAQPQPKTGDTTWSPVTSLRISVYLHAAVPLGEKIYVIGGYHKEHSSSYAIPDVFSARVLESGALSGWESENSLTNLAENGISAHAAVASEDHQCVYVIGGWLGSYSSGSPHNRVFRACIETNGKLGAWREEPSALPLIEGADGIYYHSATIIGDRVFVLGGAAYKSGSPEPTDSVYIGRIDASSHLGNWTVCKHCLSRNLERQGSAVVNNGSLYIIGGRDRSLNSVYDDVLFTPLLHFGKSATPSGYVTYGDTINYTLRLDNLGVRDLEDIIITDTVETNVPATFEFHDLPDECQACLDVNNTFTCTVPTLELGDTKDINFTVTIQQPATAPLSLSPTTSASSTYLAQTTWTQPCAKAHLEVQGVGITGLWTNTLYIPSPETIVGNHIRVQAAFKGETLPDEVIICSNGDCYALTQNTSTTTAVYEKDIPVSGAVSVMVHPVDGWTGGLTAYFLRTANEGYSLIGHPMNQSEYRSVYTEVLKLPIPANNSNLTVRAVIIDNDHIDRDICLTAQAGGMSDTICFDEPLQGNHLDIRELQLSGVPAGTTDVTVIAESPQSEGESFVLVGLVAETAGCLPYVLNKAQACVGPYCWDTSCMNAYYHVYLPLVLRNGP